MDPLRIPLRCGLAEQYTKEDDVLASDLRYGSAIPNLAIDVGKQAQILGQAIAGGLAQEIPGVESQDWSEETHAR